MFGVVLVMGVCNGTYSGRVCGVACFVGVYTGTCNIGVVAGRGV